MTPPSRRRFLRRSGAALLAGTTGCSSDVRTVGDAGDGGGGRAFDPAVHGFGFRNWATTGDRYPSHSHEIVTEREIERVLRRDWGTYVSHQNWMSLSRFPPELREAIVKQLYVSINQGSATDGHCFGMAYAAYEYFRSPDRLPEGYRVASSVESPAAEVGDAVDFHHNRQILDPHTWGAWMLLYSGFELDYRAQIDAVRAAIDDTGAAGLAMATWPRLAGHTVLAYDYRASGGEVVLAVYDPNWSAGEYRERTRTIRFDASGPEPVLRSPYDRRYDRVAYVGTGLSLPAMVRTGANVVFRYLLGGIVTFLVDTDVSMTVTDATGTELGRDVAEYMSRQATGYSNIRYRYGDPAGTYRVRITAPAGTRYSLEIEGASRRGWLIDRDLSGTVDAATAVHEYSVTVPGSPDEPAEVVRRR